MKKLIGMIGMLSLVLSSQSCNDDLESVSQQISVGFTAESFENELLGELPPGSKLILSLTTPGGEPVIDHEEIAFEYRKDRFVTEPLNLAYGSYVITDFILVNEENEVIYATPKATGRLSSRVRHALDLNLTLSVGKIPVDLDLQLLEVRKQAASDFGYLSFNKPGQALKIMVTLKGSSKPTSAKAFILNDRNTINEYILLARVNHIVIPGSATQNDRFVIRKEGYAPVEFSVQDLRQYRNKPLKVILAPAFTIMAHLAEWYYNPFEIALSGMDGSSIIINWGDGTTESYEMNSGVQPITHEYSETGDHPVTITGDIDKITYFKCFYDNLINEINFQHLTNLREIHYGLTGSPRVVDLSHNSQLQSAILPALGGMEELYLAETHTIRSISVEGNGLSTAMIDAVINSVHKNAVSQNIMSGYFGLGAVLYQPWWDESLVGPPSAEALDKLKALKENYGWEISPDPFD